MICVCQLICHGTFSPCPIVAMKKQVRRLNRLDRKRGVERQTMMSSLNLRFVACSTFSPIHVSAAPLRNYLAIDRSSLDVLARCRCIACISSDGKIIVRAYCVREQGPIAAAAAAAAAVPSAAVPLPPRACQLAESHHMLPHE
jgi:hypothetical protein